MIRRCTIKDVDMINEFMRSEDVFKFIKDDCCSDKNEFDISGTLENKDNILMSNDNLVFVLFIPRDPIVFEAHVFCHPDIRGREAVKKAKEILRIIYENTTCNKMIGFTPEYHKAAVLFSKWVGFKRIGVLTNSILKDGKWHNEIISQHGMEDL